MQKEELEQIERMRYLEEKISKIKSKYSINDFFNNTFGAEKTLDFLFDKIASEEKQTLNLDECEYFRRACLIPIQDIKEEIEYYDNSSSKIDELTFLDNLSKKYNVEVFLIIERIQDVRKINKTNFSEPKRESLVVPYFRPFVVVQEKAKEFKKQVTSGPNKK